MEVNLNEMKMQTAEEFFRMKLLFERLFTPVAQECGLSKVTAILLHLIGKCSDATVKTVISELDLNQGNASTMCKKLEAQGYIIRKRSRSDERSVTLEITDSGREALIKMEKTICAMMRSTPDITKEEISAAYNGIAAACSILTKINNNLSEREITNA